PDADDADEDGRELHVRRHPGPELLQRLAMPFVERDELGSAWLHCGYLVAVGAFTYLGLDDCGRRTTGTGHLQSTPCLGVNACILTVLPCGGCVQRVNCAVP